MCRNIKISYKKIIIKDEINNKLDDWKTWHNKWIIRSRDKKHKLSKCRDRVEITEIMRIITCEDNYRRGDEKIKLKNLALLTMSKK